MSTWLLCVGSARIGTGATETARVVARRSGRFPCQHEEAEAVLRDVMAAGGLRDRIFIAIKLEEPDAAGLKRSLSRLRTDRLDLLQLHNVRDTQQSLAQFKDWEAEGTCRYIGITSTRRRDYPAVEAVLGREKPDFDFLEEGLSMLGYSCEEFEIERL